jgi:hypothetical protein
MIHVSLQYPVGKGCFGIPKAIQEPYGVFNSMEPYLDFRDGINGHVATMEEKFYSPFKITGWRCLVGYARGTETPVVAVDNLNLNERQLDTLLDYLDQKVPERTIGEKVQHEIELQALDYSELFEWYVDVFTYCTFRELPLNPRMDSARITEREEELVRKWLS